jgi:hypothetical protein
VTVVLHIGVSQPTACRSGRDAAHAVAVSRPMACRSGRDAARVGREPLPHPSATDKWGRDRIQTVPSRCCPLDHTAHMVWPANKCFSNFPNCGKFVKYKMPSSGAPKFS